MKNRLEGNMGFKGAESGWNGSVKAFCKDTYACVKGEVRGSENLQMDFNEIFRLQNTYRKNFTYISCMIYFIHSFGG